MSELIAGFPKSAWDKFRQPIPKELVSKDPKGMDYVKHQVCSEMLNECFGVDGWWQEITATWFQPQYQYAAGDKNMGRAYAEVQVKLFIGAPGSEPVCRENIGSQVAGGDWSETRKGATSEALKRAASLFGWASNVYRTEAFGEYEERANGNGHTRQDDVDHAQYNGDGTPANAAAERFDAAPTFPEPEEVVDLTSFLTSMKALAITDPKLIEKCKQRAGYAEVDALDTLSMEALQNVYGTTRAAKLKKMEAAV